MPFILRANRDNITVNVSSQDIGDAVRGAKKLDAQGWTTINLLMPDGQCKTVDELYELELKDKVDRIN